MQTKDRLQIILITYNRKEYVKRTLEKFILDEASPVKDFCILILDNNSTDGTSEYIKSLQNKHKNLEYSKNNYNLGISGNIAKAMEIAKKDYLWIIADDDVYDWTSWNEIEQAIGNNEQVICAARYALKDKEKNKAEWQLLQMAFVPAIIINTALFSDTTIRNAFDNIFTLFPHLFPVVSHINSKKDIFVVSSAIVDNGMDLQINYSYTRGIPKSELLCDRTKTMSWIVGYANVCSLIQNKRLKYEAMNCAIKIIYGSFSNFCMDMHRLYFREKYWFQVFDVWLQLNFTKKIRLSASFIRRLLFGAATEEDNFVIRFFGLKIKLKKHIEGDYSVLKFKFIKIRKHIKNRTISLKITK